MSELKKDKLIEALRCENELLDRKIGNMFYIYKASSKLFDKITSEELSQLATELFAEFTKSEFTTLFLRDEISENFVLSGQFSFSNKLINNKLILYPSGSKLYFPGRLDLHELSQRELFMSQFYNSQELIDCINPTYLITIQSESKILGFITLGEKEDREGFEREIIDIVESLGRAMSIAFITAENFKRANEETKKANTKYKKLMALNSLINNVNSATTAETVFSLIKSMLEISYNVNLAFLAFHNQNDLEMEIASSINLKGSVLRIPLKGELLPLLVGEKVLAFDEVSAKNLFDRELIDDLELPMGGACLLPICIEEYDMQLIGVLAILGLEQGVLCSDENIMIFEFIANHMAPILYHIKRVETIKETYHPDYYEKFLQALSSNMEGADIFSLDLYVIWVMCSNRLLFSEDETIQNLKDYFEDIHIVDHQNALMLTTEPDDINRVKASIKSEDNIKVIKYKEDFNSIEEFKQLF